MKYSILMPYVPRIVQFSNTLVSLKHWYQERRDWQIIVVPDPKCSVDDIDDLRHTLNQWLVPCGRRTWTIVTAEPGEHHSPSAHYNTAAEIAVGEYLMITNPECLHTVDILGGLDIIFARKPQAYVVCGCDNSKGVPALVDKLQDFEYTSDQWFQHSVHWPSLYHFCSVISRRQYQDLGGFDDRYRFGRAFDDDDWRDTVLQAGLDLVLADDLKTVHQFHPRVSTGDKAESKRLWTLNRDLYIKRCGERGIPYRANKSWVKQQSAASPQHVI